MSDDFRWQAFFQRSTEPLFLLNRQLQILFVNEAWERLTGVSADAAHRLACNRTKPPKPATKWLDQLRHVLCPPDEVQQGTSCRARRLIPAREGQAPRWWDVEHLPFCDEKGLRGILGKITLGPAHALQTGPPMPEVLANLRRRQLERYRLDHVVARVPAMRRVHEQVRLASRQAAPVLLVGEPGVGKRTLAKFIHYQSDNAELALADLDCARLPARTVEAILIRETPAAANVGAVLLREPAALPRETQARLAEQLNRCEPPRVFASAAHPEAQVAQQQLSEELFHALSVTRIDVPNLRQRRDELPYLIDQQLNEASAGAATGLTADAWEIILAYDWPDNLRELRAVVQSAHAHCEGESIDAEDLPAYVRQSVDLERTLGQSEKPVHDLKQIVAEVERRLIARALQRAEGQKTKAAELLSVSRAHLARRMEALGLEKP